MKKFLCVLISALLITCCFAVNCFAANDGEINGAAVYAAPGSTVELPVKYVNNPGFWIMFLEVNFDPDVFEYVGIENGDYDKAEIVPQTYKNKGKVLLDIEGVEYADLTGDGVIATLKLAIKENAKVGNYQINYGIGDGMAVNFDVGYVVPVVKSSSVYVVCSAHDFKENKCSVCGAVKEGEEVKVDVEKLPEPIKPVIKDVEGINVVDGAASELPSANNEGKPADNKDNETDTAGAKPDTKLLIIICGGAIVLCAAIVVTIIIVKKKKDIIKF